MAIVLLADDEKDVRATLAKILIHAGHEVLEASNVAEAKRCADQHPLDVALIDIMMGNENGLDVAHYLRDCQPDVRTILITGAPNFASAREAISLRIFDYLLKPIERQGLLTSVGKAAAAKASEEEYALMLRERERFHDDLERRVRVRTAELHQAAVNLQALTNRLQDVREEERKALARELHDEFGQKLTALQIDMDWLARQTHADQPGVMAAMREKIAGMLPLVAQLTEMTQAICAALRPGMLDDLGLLAAIDWQVDECAKRTGLTFSSSLPDVDVVLDRNVALALFRIFQESLTNTVRHAKATHVEFRVRVADNELEMEIKDNGRGFTPESVPTTKALGLLSMRERASGFQGTVNVLSILGKGTTVQVRMPLVQQTVAAPHAALPAVPRGLSAAGGTGSQPFVPLISEWQTMVGEAL